MTLKRAILKLQADIDDTTEMNTGVFEMVGDLSVENSVQPGFVIGGTGATMNAVVQSSLDTAGDFLFGDGDVPLNDPQKRAGLFLDLGGGRHTFSLNFIGWDGATDQNGNELQWGDPDATGLPADATGEDPITQMQVLARYLKQGEFDSRARRAEFEFGEYGSTDDELWDPLHVTIERANFTRAAGEEGYFDGTMLITEVVSYSDPQDVIWRDDQ